MKTKFSKSFTTFFFPVGNEISQFVDDWVNYLRQGKLWGNDDPLFPATQMVVGATRRFEVAVIKPKHWSSAAPIRGIFSDAFDATGLPYFNPHSLRAILVQLGEARCQTPEQFKAWSQNLGHEAVLTTFYNYGQVGNQRQGRGDHSKPYWPPTIRSAENRGTRPSARARVTRLRSNGVVIAETESIELIHENLKKTRYMTKVPAVSTVNAA